MSITSVLALLGGLALFLYGMQMMSGGLESIAGNRMKSILEKLTSNRFLGVAVGAGITAVIQSSSATTVMVVGFVNTGMMTLRQAVWIIMGANIGTTITGQLISLDVGAIAPLVAFLGVALIVFLKAPKTRNTGEILGGFGMLFIGMDMMGAAMEPLRHSEAFVSLMTQFSSNPLLGILAGAVFTAVIQSSSASIGILQTLALNGLISFPSAVFVLFGQNIGTCITAVLASIGTNRNARRTTIIHLLFNLTGTTIFTLACLVLPITNWVGGITPDNPVAQIANMHTVFNIATTLLLLPFGTFLAKIAQRILPNAKEEVAQKDRLAVLMDASKRGNSLLGYSAVHMDILRQEIIHMLQLARNNVERGFNAVIFSDAEANRQVEETEEELDFLNKEISKFISNTLIYNQSGADVADTEEYFVITGNTERIGDHAANIGGYVKVMAKDSIQFSEGAVAELKNMQALTVGALDKILSLTPDTDKTEWLSEIAAVEQQIDDLTVEYRENHIGRMKRGECSAEGCILFSELLTDFERIGDHFLNIAQAYTKMRTE